MAPRVEYTVGHKLSSIHQVTITSQFLIFGMVKY